MTLFRFPPASAGPRSWGQVGLMSSCPSLETNSISLSSGSDLFGQVTRARIKATLCQAELNWGLIYPKGEGILGPTSPWSDINGS